MDELINKILAMPDITLDASEWRLAIQIFGYLPNKSADNFKATLDRWMKSNPGLQFDNDRLQHLLNYITQWNEMTTLLLTTVEQISAVWKNIFFEKLGTDDLLPTLIELIECDEAQLKKLLHKVNVAMKLDDASREACALTNFRCAVDFKVNKIAITENDKKYFAKIHERVQEIKVHLPTAAEEVKRQHQLHKLSFDLGNYKMDLTNLIKQKLIGLNKEVFERAFDRSQDIDMQIFSVINGNNLLRVQRQMKAGSDILADSSPSYEIADPEILLLFDKFSAVFDLYATCSAREKKRSIEKTEEFAKKYEFYKEKLDANGDQIGKKILKTLTLYNVFEQLYLLLPEFIRARTTQERFSQTVGRLFPPEPVAIAAKPQITNPARLLGWK